MTGASTSTVISTRTIGPEPARWRPHSPSTRSRPISTRTTASSSPGSQVGGKSFLGPRAILAHSVHCQDSELARMAETGTSIAHCPTSQQFLGSGTMPWKRTVASGVNIAIGSDFGGGDECLLTRVLGDAFKVHISEAGDDGVSMHPAELLFTGTLAGARALDMENRIGNFDEAKRPTSW